MSATSTSQLVYLNGDFIPLADASISVLDRGFLFGDGIYEVIPAYHGQLFHLQRHLTRLQDNLDKIRLNCPIPTKDWQAIFQQLLLAHEQESVYLQVTRGVALRDHAFPENTIPTIFVMANSVVVKAKQGISAITLEDDRWQHCDIKNTSLLPNVLLRQLAHDQQADEAILLRDGIVTEGAGSNVFIVDSNGTILTAPKSPYLLPGVTRDVVLELIRAAQLPLEERTFDKQTLLNAREIWITSSTKEIVPVTQLNGNPIGSGRIGNMWNTVNALFQSHKQTLQQSTSE